MTTYDAIVVGSGAAGGMAVYELTQAGMRVLLLEAGRNYDPASETPMFQTPQLAPLRASSTADKQGGYFDATVGGGWDIPGEPYTVSEGTFRWWRARMLGGRTNHWGRVALRCGPYDFKPRQRDGLGHDWPISYSDLEPWYERIEQLIGVTGGNEGLENSPNSRPGTLLPPPPLRPHEFVLKRAFAKANIATAAMHAAVLTKPLNGRPACLYATPCTRGCSIGANFQSTTVLIPPAVRSGRLTVRCDAVAFEVSCDRSGHASGVSFIDRQTGAIHSVAASFIVLAAGACSTARILLNSRSPSFPNGMANTSGLVGKYLMDSVGTSTYAHIPMLEDLPPRNDDGIYIPHMYAPWWGYGEQLAGRLDFPRGYHIEPRGGQRMPSMDVGTYVPGSDMTFGRKLWSEVARKYGSYISLSGLGEMIPNEQTFCDIDPDVKDQWGVPVLRFHWQWSDHELRQAAHMRRTFLEIVGILGGKVVTGGETDGKTAILGGGENAHEVGTCRMGTSPKDGVVNGFGQAFDVPNLFIVDGSIFTSSPDKNPTLTILALASRASSHLVETAKSGSA